MPSDREVADAPVWVQGFYVPIRTKAAWPRWSAWFAGAGSLAAAAIVYHRVPYLPGLLLLAACWTLGGCFGYAMRAGR